MSQESSAPTPASAEHPAPDAWAPPDLAAVPFGTEAPRLLDSRDVLGGHSSVVIAHRGGYYRLQATRQGKLILTK